MRTVVAIRCLLAVAAAVMLAPATARALPTLEIRADHPGNFRVYDDEYQAITKLTMTVIPDGADTTVDLAGVQFNDYHGASFAQYVTQVAWGVDTNGDGVWVHGVDAIFDGLPPSRLGGGSSLRVGNQEILFNPGAGGPVGYGAAWTRSFTAPPGPILVLEAGQTYEWFLLYRVSSDAPLDTVFHPSFPQDGIYGVYDIDGWGSDLFQFAGQVHLPYGLIYDFDEMIVILPDGTTAPLVTIPRMALYCRPFSAEGVIATDVPHEPNRTVVAGDADVVMGELRLAALGGDDEGYTLGSLGVVASSGDPAQMVNLRLVLDNDDSGSLTTGDTVLDHDASGSLQALGAATLDFGALADAPALQDAEYARILLVCDFTGAVRDGMLYQFTIESFSVTPGATSGLPVVFAGVTGRTAREPLVRLALTAGETDRRVTAGETLTAAALQLDALDVETALEWIELDPAGDAMIGRDLADVALVHDRNGNGTVEAGEPVLANGRFRDGSTTMRLSLASALTMAPGSRTHLLVTVVVDAAAPDGVAYGMAVTGIGTAGAPAISGLPLATGLLMVGSDDGDIEFDPVIDPDDMVVTPGGAVGCNAGGTAVTGTALWLVVLVAGLAVTTRRRS